jgi:hypothetical protein
MSSLSGVAGDLNLEIVDSPDDERDGIHLYAGSDITRTSFQRELERRKGEPGNSISKEMQINLTLESQLVCRTVVLTSGNSIVDTLTFVNSLAREKTQIYCASLSTLVALGFKGRVSTIDPCMSILCAPPNSAVPSDADATSLHFLYGARIKRGMLGADAAISVRDALGQ